jgi:hypothetical protein
MTDFSCTSRHIADGRDAAAALIEQLVAEGEKELAELARAATQEAEQALAPAPVRRTTIRLWDRRNRAA